MGDSGATVAGYTYDEMIAYYLMTQVSRAFSSMPGLATGIALQIREGEIKKFLIQPVDLVGFLLLGALPTNWCTTSWRRGRLPWCSFCAEGFSPDGPTRA